MARVFDHFRNPEHTTSQRQFAQQQGVPRSTLGYWLRQETPAGVEEDLAAFLRSQAGCHFLLRIVLALFLVFVWRGACGLRLLGLFLRLTQLDHFVASSYGALFDLGQAIQADLTTFAAEERSRLAQGMKPRTVAVVPAENFHGPSPCLVAIEPVSNFILVEQYQPRRDGPTWTEAIRQGIAGLPVEILLLSSDQARGLIACARDGLQAQHLPELFHGQRDLAGPLLGVLRRHQAAAQKQLEQAQGVAQHWQDEAVQAATAGPRPGRQTDYSWRIAVSVRATQQAAQRLRGCADRHDRARAAVRGLGDAYHPFDAQTGQPVTAEQMEHRLGQHLGELAAVIEQGQLGGKAEEALTRGRRWVVALVGVLGWFGSVARRRVEEMDLAEEAQRVVRERLLPGLYGQQAAQRGRTREERQHRKELAGRLLQEAWSAAGALGRLPAEQRQEVERVGREVVGLFARSSSCVEGRNGRLSLFHHGQTRLSAARLAALTVVHNYLSERADGTTAAERFFGQKPRDAFTWLLQRLPELPRPSAKRPKKGVQGTPGAQPGWPN